MHHRSLNFEGAPGAAKRLVALSEFVSTACIKCNPDTPPKTNPSLECSSREAYSSASAPATHRVLVLAGFQAGPNSGHKNRSPHLHGREGTGKAMAPDVTLATC